MNWFYRLWKRIQLLRTRDLAHKMELEGANTVSSTAQGINDQFADALPGLRGLRVRLAQLKTRLVESLFATDQWGNKEPLNQPLFTPDRVSSLRRQRLGYLVVVVVFVICEVALYYLISNSLVGGIDDEVVREVAIWGVAVVFAFFVLFAYSFSLTTLFDFIDARELHARQRITRRAYQAAITKLIWGAALFAFSVGFLLYAGWARIALIENATAAANKTVNDAGLRAALEEGSRSTGIMALLFTFGMAILLGFMKRSLDKVKGEWAAYKAWQANTTEQERIAQRIAKILAGLLGYLNTKLEVGVQLTHDLQRIYGQQVDPSRVDLFKEFETERAKPGFKVTLDILNQFRPVLAADDQLFTAAVLEKLSLKELREALDDETITVTTSLEELYTHLRPKSTSKPELNETPRPMPSLNGHSKQDLELQDLLKA